MVLVYYLGDDDEEVEVDVEGKWKWEWKEASCVAPEKLQQLQLSRFQIDCREGSVELGYASVVEETVIMGVRRVKVEPGAV